MLKRKDNMNKIILCAFNIDNKRIELLKICLYSICKNTSLNAIVFYNDLSSLIINEILEKLPLVSFINFDLKINKDIEIASQKMYMWNDIISDMSDNNNVILSDLDTLYLKDPSDAFNFNFDIGFTAKDNTTLRYPLNTGIAFVRVSKKSKDFFKHWLDHTIKILENDTLSKEAINTYGGADQKALAILIGQKISFGEINTDIARLYCFLASEYNVHKDWSDPCAGGRMIHYKGGWKEILINEYEDLNSILENYRDNVKKDFTNWKKSFLLWRKYYKEYYSL